MVINLGHPSLVYPPCSAGSHEPCLLLNRPYHLAYLLVKRFPQYSILGTSTQRNQERYSQSVATSFGQGWLGCVFNSMAPACSAWVALRELIHVDTSTGFVSVHSGPPTSTSSVLRTDSAASHAPPQEDLRAQTKDTRWVAWFPRAVSETHTYE